MKGFTIYGKLPGLNDAFGDARSGTRRNGYNAEAQKRRELEEMIIMSARRGLKRWQTSRPVILHYTFYEPNRRRDKDNVAGYAMKLIQDALVKGGFLGGDGWAYIENFDFDWRVDKAKPRVEVEIEEV